MGQPLYAFGPGYSGWRWPALNIVGEQFTIGYVGGGTLTVTRGASVTAANAVIASAAGSNGVVQVDGTGSTWTNGNLYVGNSGNGTLNITNGGAVMNASTYAYIGYNSGSTGTVTVDGIASKWTSVSGLYVGNSGNGTLKVTDGGAVSVAGATYVGAGAGSSGAINFGTNGGTLTTQMLYASQAQLSGEGTINTLGVVGDMDLVFDSTHGMKQTFMVQNVALNLDMSSGTSTLGVGWVGSGSITIHDGAQIKSSYGYLGYQSGSNGMATISGSNSTWTSKYIYVGASGCGTLSITGGATANDAEADFAIGTGTSGVVRVDGAGSTWICPGMQLGFSGNGILIVTNGGTVDSRFNGTDGCYVGCNAGAMGSVTVDGNGSTWMFNPTANNQLNIGYGGGSGAMRIANGGAVISGSGDLAWGSGSAAAVVVTGNGSKWTNGGTLYVAGGGTGTLCITCGAALSDSSGYIGASGTGEVMVDGTGSKWTSRRRLLCRR